MASNGASETTPLLQNRDADGLTQAEREAAESGFAAALDPNASAFAPVSGYLAPIDEEAPTPAAPVAPAAEPAGRPKSEVFIIVRPLQQRR